MRVKNDTYILGVTGGIASGKTRACAVLKSIGAEVIDADEISRSLTAEGGRALAPILSEFGPGVFAEDGTLDRRALSSVVFGDAERRERLNAIVHPMVIEETISRIENFRKGGARVVVLNVPLLLESGMEAMCDGYWVMAAEPEEQISRLMDRDHLTRSEAQARIDAQWPLAKKAKGASAVIQTGRPAPETQEEISRLYAQLLASIDGEK